ncbi:MAG: helix-turn-helix domain-containing protein [Planctomycetes bacterium]|nr:helix-turn-helix domain-containing protein [Planctomycetota bacterium]
MTNDYVQRVNRAIDHVLQNLADPLHLEDLARIACFSPFHFHRIFRSLTGEPVRQFIRRVRLDRALVMLSQRPRRSMTEIALASGFGSSSDFTRTFKQRFGTAPSAFDLAGFRDQRRDAWQDFVGGASHRHLLDRLPDGANPDGFAPSVVGLPPRRVAYIRVPESFRPGVVVAAVERLVAWADERGIGDGQWLGYMWDDPEIVPPEKCRYDVGLVLPEERDIVCRGEVGSLEFPAMRVAQLEVRGPIDLEMRAIDWFFRTWLPTSGYVPAEQPLFEAWLGRPFAHGHEHFELRVELPITREPAS